jgi:hypothetical protein
VVADGPWTAQLTLRSGLVERSVEAGLTFPGGAGQQAAPVDVEQLPVAGDEVVGPLRLLTVLGIPLLALCLLLLLRRRGRPGRRGTA